MAEVKLKPKEWKKEKPQSSRTKTVGTLVEEFKKNVTASYR